MTDREYRQLTGALRGHALPAAFVDLAAFDANARTLRKRAGEKPIRVASKSIRCVALLRRALESGLDFRGVMCFSADEAAWLSGQGFDDLLVAYPTVNIAAVDAICARIAAGARIVLTADSAEHLSLLAQRARQAGVQIPVSIDMDMSLRLPGLNFGVWRSPLRTPEALVALARLVADDAHLQLAAVMGYEAQLAGVPDAAVGAAARNRVVRLLKQRSRRVIRRRFSGMLRAVDEAGMRPPVVNAGGTGSLEFSAGMDGVTEVSAGSGFFNPWLFDGYGHFQLLPAAGFAVSVVRKPAADKVTCLGGGYPASGAKAALPRPWLPTGLRLSATEGAGEVQTPVVGPGAVALEVGDPVLFRHAKAGELCERFNTLLLIDGHRVVDEVPTYRGEGRCFL